MERLAVERSDAGAFAGRLLTCGDGRGMVVRRAFLLEMELFL